MLHPMFLSSANKLGARCAQRLASKRAVMATGSERYRGFAGTSFRSFNEGVKLRKPQTVGIAFASRQPLNSSAWRARTRRPFSIESLAIAEKDNASDDDTSSESESDDDTSGSGEEDSEGDNGDDRVPQKQVARAQVLASVSRSDFAQSEELHKEAVDIVRQLSAHPSRKATQTSFWILGRLVGASPADINQSELLHCAVRNWANCRERKKRSVPSLVSWLCDRKASLTPNCETVRILLREAKNSSSVLSSGASLKEAYANDESLCRQVDECTENRLIQMNTRGGTLVQAMERAKKMIEGHEGGEGSSLKLHDDTFMTILVAALKCPVHERPKVADFLAWVGEQYEKSESPIEVRVESIFHFARAVQIQSQSEDEQPEWLLESIGWIGQKAGEGCNPTTEDYENAIKLWASAGNTVRVKKLLDLMHHEWQNGSATVVPSLDSYNAVLACLADYGGSGAGNLATDLLKQLTDQSPPGLVPNYLTYSLVIKCLENSKDGNAPAQVMRIVQEMADISKREGGTQLESTQALLFSVLCILKKDSHLLEKFLQWLEKESNQRTAGALLSFNFGESYMDGDFMLGLCREGALVTPRLLGHARRYYAKSGQAVKAEKFMTIQYDLHLKNQAPQPMVSDYNSVLEAWSKSDAPRAAERADAIVQRMTMIHGVKLENSMPNQRTYEVLLSCWNRSGLPQAEQRREELKLEIMNLRGETPE